MRGIALFPIAVDMPDTFSYSFDGKTLTMQEHFKEADQREVDVTIQVMKNLFPGCTIDQCGTRLTVIMEFGIEAAIAGILGEMLNQARVHDMISEQTLSLILGELMAYANKVRKEIEG